MALRRVTALSIVLLAVQAQTTSSASACSTIAALHAAPSVAPGFRVQVVANGLTRPRGIQFDAAGGLLVVEQAVGITRLRLAGEGACVRVEGQGVRVVSDGSLNHGIALSRDGRTLYGSSATDVYAWNYDASQGSTTSSSRVVIGDLGDDGGHETRTLLITQNVPDMLLVSRGSLGNIDPSALNVSTGISTIKAFNMANATGSEYSYIDDGLLLGWGLRNSVGVAEDPASGAIYSVENSVDNFARNGENVHQNNPGEEMNYHGFLNGTATEQQGGNYGYPSCFAAWDVDEIPNNNGIQTGSQVAIGNQTDTVNDNLCQNDRVAPRLTFAAHMAPLDLKFNTEGTAAWVAFHGSWNRDEPIGYKLSLVQFDGNGSPIASSDSQTAAIDIVANPDMSACPGSCFRPVGLAWDSQGRLFMSSDSTGEIYVVTRDDGSGVNDVSEGPVVVAPSGTPSGRPTASPSATTTSGASQPTGSAQSKAGMNEASYWLLGAGFVGALQMV
ncbi:soluble quino protein glucose dehydrogenase [Dothidotthia symphoricarpi CBS 119687]|uniref:Soluble quino protein glucose dehydrogenase n=1 Tax=Dothidotthia symphoricarpi CBS 119687 TaxID=1392245 RepID=A0A6A6AIQ2_9PLEO|nr:soluble quino protein glucose dehydrogenase [Dothidotthia symphoricarpi CBS 119687]KAF2131436.1 soluble quino protein glucose dehydrogenase [Dothidotthia symphoricarpi CBS 119687]